MPKIIPRKFGTILVDPPWPYQKVKGPKSGGYSVEQYPSLGMGDLEKLPIGKMADYLFLWSTSVFLAEGKASRLVRRWGFCPITCLYWVKGRGFQPTNESPFSFKPEYGVGYWFRGCVEPILLAKKQTVPSIRTHWLGLICPSAGHSRKPTSIHNVIESVFPGPFCEVFARKKRTSWSVFGNEAPGDGRDVRESLARWDSV